MLSIQEKLIFSEYFGVYDIIIKKEYWIRNLYDIIDNDKYDCKRLNLRNSQNDEFLNQDLTPYKLQNDNEVRCYHHLFKWNNTARIARMIKDMYAQYRTKQTVSNITVIVVDKIHTFNHRKLSKKIYGDLPKFDVFICKT